MSSHFTAPGEDEAPRHPLELAVCRRCATLQLASPFPVEALRPPDWMHFREPEAHLDAVIERVLDLCPERPLRAAGLSVKDHSCVERLRRLGRSETDDRAFGPPFFSAVRDAYAGRLDTLSPRVPPEELDVLFIRHLLEHVPAPGSLLGLATTALAPGGLMVVEVPDCRKSLALGDHTMLWEEHAFYFVPETLTHALSAAGLEVVDVAVYPEPFEDLIVAFTRVAPGGIQPPALPPAGVPDGRSFAASFDAWRRHYAATLEALRRRHGRIAVFGAGHLSAAFVNFYDLERFVSFVVDDTPEKSGRRLAGTALEVRGSAALLDDGVGGCLLGVSPRSEAAIMARNAAFTNRGGVWLSLLADSPRSLRTPQIA